MKCFKFFFSEINRILSVILKESWRLQCPSDLLLVNA